MVLFLLVYDKKQIRLGTIIVFILYGFVLDLTVMYVPAPENTLLQWVVMFVGIIVFGIGIGVYAYTDLGRGPYDGICFAFVEKKNWQMKYVRAVADGSCLVAGFLMGGEIGVATVTSMILSGYFIQITTEVMDKIVRNRCAA